MSHRLRGDDTQSAVLDIKESLKEIEEDIKGFYDRADQRYASKVTEKIVYGSVGAIGLAVLYAILREIGI